MIVNVMDMAPGRLIELLLRVYGVLLEMREEQCARA